MSSHAVPATPVVLVMVLVEAVLPPTPVVVPPVVVAKLVVLVAPPAPVTLLAVITEPLVPVDVVEELDELVDMVPLVVDAALVGLPVPVLLVTLVVMVLLATPPFVTLKEFVGPVAVKLVGPEVSLVLPGGVLSTTVAQPGTAPFKQVAKSRPQNPIVPFVIRPERCAACFKVTLAGY